MTGKEGAVRRNHCVLTVMPGPLFLLCRWGGGGNWRSEVESVREERNVVALMFVYVSLGNMLN